MAKWEKIKSRGKVDDRRSNPGFGSLPIPMLGGSMGGLSITAVLLILLFSYVGGNTNVVDILGQLEPATQSVNQEISTEDFDAADEYKAFASQVLGSNNDYWQSVFSASSRTYIEPELVLFRNSTSSSCGGASSAVGPHYCSLDGTIYLDETFFEELQQRFGAKGGDVAEAYVIAHEVGHHVQQQLGLSEQVYRAKRSGDPNANDLSIKLELQADCFAGLWANSISDIGVFDPNEVQEAIDAAAAVGDDRIQKSTTGRVDPESWTHGSSAQRVRWFNTGLYSNGQPSVCDTF